MMTTLKQVRKDLNNIQDRLSKLETWCRETKDKMQQQLNRLKVRTGRHHDKSN